ncbi:hypothetical protein GE21DRAFT_4440 [Neurospora crassa]|uniref:Uncharacterized protein n=1 Tax=Neurospora crassa (strain ATCC 24698 / 74-OR23-1A / CBS 708.71 / DSM 1257 / FGSC 987) TaxID=367110 RepID=Q7RXQ9_NEUCR|nr:hypothetical protein NCU00149 [Neurospora crassa OR74A]EAA27426.1 hypothetical protein NCU00149 [Neurospora crassa OR74A]KHE89448.1 hypothetical protein GE21DRAFT_4440 [Neurospora crassa]|eukprot:XP_956662.1 hypothetical protein NCU00149 [Neurospora crassa OR74A]
MDNKPPPKHESVGQKLSGKQEEELERSMRLLQSKMDKDQWEAEKKKMHEAERKAKAEAAEKQKMKEEAEKGTGTQ